MIAMPWHISSQLGSRRFACIDVHLFLAYENPRPHTYFVSYSGAKLVEESRSEALSIGASNTL